jgi:hypothetical protein
MRSPIYGSGSACALVLTALTAYHGLITASATSLLEYNSGSLSVGRSLHEAEASSIAPESAPTVAFSGEPVPYNWGAEFVTTLSEDSTKYEEELSELLDSPLSEWEVFPRVRFHTADRYLNMFPSVRRYQVAATHR